MNAFVRTIVTPRKILSALVTACIAFSTSACGSSAPVAAPAVTVTAPPVTVSAPPMTSTLQLTVPTTVPVTVQKTLPTVTATRTLAPVTVIKTVQKTLPAVTQRLTATVVSTADPVTVTAQPAAPASAFGDGVQLVGTDVQPGTYRAPGGSSCYWERLSGASGSLDDIIANEVSVDNPVVEISAGDYAFKSSDCGSWTKIG